MRSSRRAYLVHGLDVLLYVVQRGPASLAQRLDGVFDHVGRAGLLHRGDDVLRSCSREIGYH